MQRFKAMGRLFKQTVDISINRSGAGRSLTIFPDDIFIVSYPRSGNTWTRFLIGNLLFQEESMTFSNIENKVPDIYQNHDYQLLKIPRRRCLKSHEYFDPRYKTIIYIVRNPKDVVISYYYYCLKVKIFQENYNIEQFITQFITGELDTFGSWGENVGSWLGARENNQDFLLIRYEDLLSFPQQTLRKISLHLQIDCNENVINRALELSSFERMQKLEKSQAKSWKPLKNSRNDISFIRKGQQEGWREVLTEAQVAYIEKRWQPLMLKLDYLNDL